jgi:hypothetical protein
MSVFGSIVSAIFGSKHAAGVTPAATSSSSAPFLDRHHCAFALAFINECSCALCHARRRGGHKADFASRR